MSDLAFISRRCSRAFTLIELLVVIVILGILMAVAVPTFLSQQTKAQDSRTQQYLTTAFKAIRSDLPANNEVYASTTSMVSWVQQSEPELTVQSGSCFNGVQSAPQDEVMVDSASTPTWLTLCARSKSGNVWELTATNTGAQTLLNGVVLVFSGNEITDAVRSAGVSGDGRSTDSSTGEWDASSNLIPAGADADLHGYNGADAGTGTPVSGGFYRFTKNSPSLSQIYSQTKLVSVTSGSVYTWSCVIRTDGTGWSFQPGSWDPTLGTIRPATTVTDLGNGSYRLSGTWTATGTTASLRAFDLWETNWGTSSYVDVKWAQLEPMPIATPYMPDGTSRAIGRIQAPAAALSKTQGWVAMRVRMGWDSSAAPAPGPRIFDWRSASNTTMRSLRYDTSGKQWQFWEIDNCSCTGTASVSVPAGFTSGQVLTVIGRWDASADAISVNGAAFTSAATSLHPAPTKPLFDIGSDGGGTYNTINGDILWFAAGTGTLSDADAATINGFGNTDPTRSQFPSTAQTTLVWDGVSSSASSK